MTNGIADTKAACISQAAYFYIKIKSTSQGEVLYQWAIRDSNPRPSGYEPDALTN